MRRFSAALAPLPALLIALTVLAVPPATAQTGVVDQAAAALRANPVYVDPGAERAGDVDAERLRDRIRAAGAPVFVAVLPAAAVEEVGDDVNRLPRELGTRTGLAGTYAAVAGDSFRAGSNTLPAGRAGALATAAFQARSGEGTEAVLVDFVERVAREQAGAGPQSTSPSAPSSPFDEGGGETSDGGGGGSSVLPVLLLAGGAGAGLWFWQRKKARDRAEDQRSRSLLEAQLAVLADDVVNLEPLVELHPAARPDYDAAVSRYRVAHEALQRTDQPIDLVRVGRVLDEAHYAMARAKAIVEGREPPPPPSELTQPGRRGEPPVDLDERGEPAYVGYGSPFYGGGWFGGGGGLLTGLFLGQMLGGGMGWGGGHDTNVYVDGGGDGGGGDGGGDAGGGGDWGGGGGDWGAGGGDWGGGDFGGGDFGGGDW